ncbi:hypothetical protein [Neobacillus sp. YIM B06451]|uniref:hypothetical protein n=1 Tax=Neobacillus sp. YIM B06451 TaxID=3070994 RepID=UPI002931B3A7|nr:hypothetical protein [Neobacillus sp. YIM B06451]
MNSSYKIKNLEYLNVNQKNWQFYWKELGLNIEYLAETKFKDVDSSFLTELKGLKKTTLIEVSSFLLGDKGKTDNYDQIAKHDLSKEQKSLFLLLREFTLRKKKSILEYIQRTKNNIEYNSELALVWSLYKEAPNLLFDLSTYHHWRNRSTDNIYTYGKSQTKEYVLKIVNEKGFRDELCNSLYAASGKANSYKLYSYSVIGNILIFHLYKKINDKTVPDFEQPVRNREVKSVLFSVDLEHKRVEIRDYTTREKEAVLKYLSKTFGDKLEEVVSEPYLDYNHETLKDTLLGADKNNENKMSPDEFSITAITFKRSILPKSPLIHFELENDDVMEAVHAAHQEGIVDLRDLKDVKSLRIKMSNSSRTIRTITLDSGDVIFSLDDGNLNDETREMIGERFKNKFDVPLNQPISNLYFERGIEEKIDYLMGIGRAEKFDNTTNEKFEELLKEKLICKIKIEERHCPVCKEVYDKETDMCFECEKSLISNMKESIEINEREALRYLERKLKPFLEYPWSVIKDRTVTIEKQGYKLLVLYHDETGEEIQFLITARQLSRKVIKKINRMAVNTVIVFAGSSEVNLEKHNEHRIVPKNFGFFYVMNNSKQFSEFMLGLSEEFSRRWKLSSSKSGLEAYRTIKEWLDGGTDYTDKDLEDDTYALINDITPNNVKWGSKYSGKIVPEGAFTLSYKTNREIGKYVYTYDCKLTGRDKGYPLDIGEQRKAAHYIRNMSTSDFLKDYINGEFINAHLIISNKVDIKKIEAMNNHLRTERLETRVKLIKIETLVRIYELYLENFRDISSKPNYFKKFLVELINKDTDELKMNEVEKEIARLLKPGLMEQQPLDMQELTDAVLKATNVEELVRK